MQYAAIQTSQFEIALQHFNNNELDKAELFLSEQLKADSNHLASIRLLSLIYFNQKKYNEAIILLNNSHINFDSDFEICNLLACCFVETDQFEPAEVLLNKALTLNPEHTNSHFNLGLVYQNTNRLDLAILSYLTTLRLQPNHLNALLRAGECLFGIQDYKSAVLYFKKIIQIDQENVSATIGLANCYIQTNDLDELELLKKAISAKHHCFSMELGIANCFLAHNDIEKSIKQYNELIDRYGRKAIIFNNLATAYDLNEDNENAIKHYKIALELEPDYTDAMINLGKIYTNSNAFLQAETILTKAIQINPNLVDAHQNLGRLYGFIGNRLASKRCYETALSLQPTKPAILYNLGNITLKLGDYPESCNYFKKCLAINPNFSDAEFNLGLNELAMGNFTNAWGHYFQRIRNISNNEALSPITPGMDLSGKRVYFCYSQGIGDELFFLRFLPKLKEQNVYVIYRASEKTYPILKNITHIDELLSPDSEQPVCDYYFTLDDLPLILNMCNGNNIPNSILLQTNKKSKEIVKSTLSQFPKPYTALTWKAGTPKSQQDKRSTHTSLCKEIELDILQPIIDSLTGTIIILQRNVDAEELDFLKQTTNAKLLNLSDLQDNLEDILALLDELDEYIGVSNTNMHLMATLDKTAKVLVPHPAEWRWQLTDQSTWFPQYSIYRQAINGNWLPAVDKLQKDLHSYRVK